MKKIITYFLAALLILAPVESFARTRLLTSSPVYKGTITGLRVSAVDGTAFIDNLPYTYQSDFSAGENGWQATRGAVAGNIDSIGGADNWLRYTADTVSGTHFTLRVATVITTGKKYTALFTYYIPSLQSNIDGVRLQANGGAQIISTVQSVLDTVTTATVTFTATTTGRIEFWAYDGASPTFQDAGGDDVFYIKDVTISEITPYMDGNHSIEIYDASNRMLKGVLKAAGTSEGLGDELLSLNFLTSWDVFSSAEIIDVDTITTSSEGGVRTKTVKTAVRCLYKAEMSGTATSGSVHLHNDDGSGSLFVSGFTTGYGTSNNSGKIYLQSTAAATIDITSLSVKQVLTPSALGATIVSAKAGETYNWTYKNPNFTFPTSTSTNLVIIKPIR